MTEWKYYRKKTVTITAKEMDNEFEVDVGGGHMMKGMPGDFLAKTPDETRVFVIAKEEMVKMYDEI